MGWNAVKINQPISCTPIFYLSFKIIKLKSQYFYHIMPSLFIIYAAYLMELILKITWKLGIKNNKEYEKR